MLNKFCNFLSELFYFPKEILKENYLKIDIRKSKINVYDTLYYRFKYIFEETTNTLQSITSSINFNNKLENNKHKYFSRIGIYKKEKQLPLSLYKDIFEKTKKYYYDTFKSDNTVILVDGVYSNTNILHNGTIETSMSLGFYNYNSSIPFDIHFTGVGKKNNECLSLKKYIDDNLKDFKGKTIICDRAYYNFSFFNYLNDNKINFIIRLRDKAFDVEPKVYSKHYKDFIKIKESNDIKVVTNKIKTSKRAMEDTNSSSNINKETTIKIITNLNIEDTKIMEMYKSRWSIEEFYKQLKHNFKFQNFSEHKENTYNKNIYASLTVTILKQIFIQYYEQDKDFKNKTLVSKKKNKEIQIIKSINENLMLKGLKDELLRKLIYGKLNVNTLKTYLDSYVKFNINETDRHNERKSKRPFTKWYVKQYHDVYKIKQKVLQEEINLILKNNDDPKVKELKIQRKKLNKEYNILKKQIKEIKDITNG